MAATTGKLHVLPQAGASDESPMQESLLSHWFLPRSGVKRMAAQEAKGVFVQWPLLIIIISLASVLIGAIVGLQVQVSNLNTTLLLRDADHGRQLDSIQRDLAKEAERRELSDLKIADLRERMAAAKIPERKNN